MTGSDKSGSCSTSQPANAKPMDKKEGSCGTKEESGKTGGCC